MKTRYIRIIILVIPLLYCVQVLFCLLVNAWSKEEYHLDRIQITLSDGTIDHLEYIPFIGLAAYVRNFLIGGTFSVKHLRISYNNWTYEEEIEDANVIPWKNLKVVKHDCYITLEEPDTNWPIITIPRRGLNLGR